MDNIYVLPVGDVRDDILKRIIPCLEERFLYRFRVLPPIPVETQAYNVIKRKYLSSALCETIRSCFPQDAKYVLGITDVDTYENYSNFVYNNFNNDNKVGLISIHRLNPAFFTQSSESDVFFQRILKEATHEIGHLLGFMHCFNSNCVMYFSYSTGDTDKKGTFFCMECEKKLNRMKQN